MMNTPPPPRDEPHTALGALYLRYHDPLCGVAQRYTDSREDAEDAVQIVFLRILGRPDRLDPLQIGYRYLRRAVVNEALHQRSRLTNSARMCTALRHEDSRIAASPEVETRLHALEIDVEAAIDALPERCRLAFQLVRVERLSYAEAAARMGVSVKTIQEQLRRGNQVLRIRLAAYGSDE